MLKKMTYVVLLGLVLGVLVPAYAEETTAYKIIVNKQNPVTSLTRGELADIYMKKVTSWDKGGTVSPLDLPEDSDIREAFSKSILGKSTAQVKAKWMKLIFSGQGVPPVVKNSEDEILEFTKNNTYAIGYISKETPAPDNKVIEIGD